MEFNAAAYNKVVERPNYGMLVTFIKFHVISQMKY